MSGQVSLRPVLEDDLSWLAGAISWRRVQTGPTVFSWAIGIGLAPQFRGRGFGSEAHALLARYLFAHTQVPARPSRRRR
jgi:RimJ/RimL family protein N-acetyltransferase